jgi:hypothetical protein
MDITTLAHLCLIHVVTFVGDYVKARCNDNLYAFRSSSIADREWHSEVRNMC